MDKLVGHGGMVHIKYNYVVGVGHPLLLFHVTMYELLFGWRQLVRLVTDHLANVSYSDFDILPDSSIVEKLGDSFPNCSRPEGVAIEVEEQSLFTIGFKLRADVEDIYLKISIQPTGDRQLSRSLVSCGFMFINEDGISVIGGTIGGFLEMV